MIRDYVPTRKKDFLNEANGAALPLEAIPGTAQLDFGEAPFIHEGEEIVLPYLVVSFPFSNVFYFQVFPSQNNGIEKGLSPYGRSTEGNSVQHTLSCR
jgi:hypothetical protein